MKGYSTALLTMTKQLVSLSTISSKDPHIDQPNKECIELLADWLDMRAFSVRIVPSAGLPEKLNLIATKGKRDSEIIFSGHIDTVPCDESQWSRDPFTLTEYHDRWYGLGVCDMKIFFPLIIEAIDRFDFNKSFKALSLVATADEESTMSGMTTLHSLNIPRGSFAIIGEPTNLIPVRMNKGIMMVSITVQGIAGHSSNPEAGKNAIDGMWHVYEELVNIREYLKSTYSNPLFDVSYPTLNFGRISGGDSPNRICPSCTLYFDVRVLPGMDINELSREIHRRLENKSREKGFSFSLDYLFPGVGAMETSPESLIVKKAEKLTGKKAGAVQFATEGYYYTSRGIETIILGPGDINQAHKPDEFLKIDRIIHAVDLYSSLIHSLCFNS
jgi:acetylornithine deacetylase